MLRLVMIDLTDADLAAFERYEAEVLRLIPNHGGRLEARVRSLDGLTETHIVQLPDEVAFESYCSDPKRLAIAHEWERSRARSVTPLVERIATD